MAQAISIEQLEETETLASIYEGDGNFKQISATNFQYKVFYWNKLENTLKLPIIYNVTIFTVW